MNLDKGLTIAFWTCIAIAVFLDLIVIGLNLHILCVCK